MVYLHGWFFYRYSSEKGNIYNIEEAPDNYKDSDAADYKWYYYINSYCLSY